MSAANSSSWCVGWLCFTVTSIVPFIGSSFPEYAVRTGAFVFSCFSEKNLEKVSFPNPMMDFADPVSVSFSKWTMSTSVVAV